MRWEQPLTYYKLHCSTCNVDFPPLLATEPLELLCPVYEEVSSEAGAGNRRQLEEFHDVHSGHTLIEVKEETTK